MEVLVVAILLLGLMRGKRPTTTPPSPVPVPPTIPTPTPTTPTPTVPPHVPSPTPTTTGETSLEVSPDCKKVIEGPRWMTDVAQPRIRDAVAQGLGRPVYGGNDLKRGLDALIRTLVASSAGVACVQNSPWLDRYYRASPPLPPQPDETRAEYIERLRKWDAIWERTVRQWSRDFPELFRLYKRIGQAVVRQWTGQAGSGERRGDPSGTPPPKVSRDVVRALNQLGYDSEPDMVRAFQSDYNKVMNYRTGLEWTVAGRDIKMDNLMGPQTREALVEAKKMSQPYGGDWMFLVRMAS